jgi:hypothetical protein
METENFSEKDCKCPQNYKTSRPENDEFLEGKKLLEKSRCRRAMNIYIKEVGWKVVNWSDVSQEMIS